MRLFAKFGGHSINGNRNINSYISPYMNTSEKAELNNLICHTERLSNSEITIYDSEVTETTGRKIARSRRKVWRLPSKPTNCIGEN